MPEYVVIAVVGIHTARFVGRINAPIPEDAVKRQKEILDEAVATDEATAEQYRRHSSMDGADSFDVYRVDSVTNVEADD